MALKKSGSGWTWGDSGKCFTGPGARQKAIEHGKAVEANRSRAGSVRMTELLENIEQVLSKKKCKKTG